MNQTRTTWVPANILVAVATTLAMVFFALALIVGTTHAQETTYSTTTPVAAPNPSMSPTVVSSSSLPPMVVSVDSAGNVLLRGTVVATGANSLTLSSWGGTWTIQTTGASEVIPGTSTIGDMSGIQAGDFIGVEGTIGSGSSWTVAASIVHDWTQSPATTNVDTNTSVSASTTGTVGVTTPMNMDSLPVGDTLYTGTATDVSNIGNNSFVLSDASGTTYTINVAPSATVWNTNSVTIPLSNIAQGDSIRLDGSIAADGSITADVVRDTSQ